MANSIDYLAPGVVPYRDLLGLQRLRDEFPVIKFGSSTGITANQFVTSAGVYPMPPPSAPVQLEAVSGDPQDNPLGTGVASVEVAGIDVNWDYRTVEVDLDGTTPVDLGTGWLRVFRLRATGMGSYKTGLPLSHTTAITVRVSGGGATWAEIPVIDGLGVGQSQIGCYSIARGYEATIYQLERSPEISSTKAINFYSGIRLNADSEVAGEMGPFRIQRVEHGVNNITTTTFTLPYGPFQGPADLVTIANATASAHLGVTFSLNVRKVE